jgi:cytochrome b561
MSLYALLFIIPVAGYVRVKAGGFPIETLDGWVCRRSCRAPTRWRRWRRRSTTSAGSRSLSSSCLHVAAAAYHGIIRRDGVFSRMWPPLAGRGG